MLKFFGRGKPDHPMAGVKEARTILENISATDSHKALEELAHWLESVRSFEDFKPDHRALLLPMIDEAAQVHVRKLQREYLTTQRLSKFQENRLWNTLHEFWKQSALAFATCVDLYASGQKGADALKSSMPLLTVRALRALAAQMKWQYVRYGPFDNALWGIVYKIYALAEGRRFSRAKVQVYTTIPGESSPEQEFMKAVMLSASSPDALLPVEIELVERLIAHFSESFTLTLDQQPDIAYWIDLATSNPPLRVARPPLHALTLRFFAAGRAAQELEQLIQSVQTTNAIPASVGLGGTYEPAVVLDALKHLALYWSSRPPERKAPRHRVKSRLAITYEFDGVLAAIDPTVSLDFGNSRAESWVVENVSAGGFGASIPQIRGDWLRIGCLLGLQPEGGENWVVGIIRRLNRESPQQGTVGIQTLARTAVTVQLNSEDGRPIIAGNDAATGILLNPSDDSVEAHILVRAGVLVTGKNLGLQRNGKHFVLMPAGIMEQDEDFELFRFRQMIRDTSE